MPTSIDSAQELVCIIFPFNMDNSFDTIFKKDKDYLRLLLDLNQHLMQKKQKAMIRMLK